MNYTHEQVRTLVNSVRRITQSAPNYSVLNGTVCTDSVTIVHSIFDIMGLITSLAPFLDETCSEEVEMVECPVCKTNEKMGDTLPCLLCKGKDKVPKKGKS